MRLTLRTLLAYLDDTLEPAEIRDIGQKVAESDAAQELIDRIKNVTHRRRLTVPPSTGPGAKFDPNTVAEYLDNVLHGEEVSKVEETCLGSDVHLAEVAACHQILTLVLGEPALVPPTAKQRMYGLVHGREAIPYRKATTSSISNEDIAVDSHADADETLLMGLPLYRRQGLLRWAIPIAGLLLIVAVGVALWQALPPSGKQVAQNTATNPEPAPTKPAEADKNDKKEETKKEGDTKPDDKKPDEKGTGKPPEEVKNPKKEAPPPMVQPAGKPNPEAREIGRYVSLDDGRSSILLHRRTAEDAWQRLAYPENQSKVSTAETLVSLPGYRSAVRLNSGVQLLLWGNVPEQVISQPIAESAVVLHVPDAPLDADFTLQRGRVTVTNRKEGGPAVVRVRFHDEVWELTLLEPDSEVGMDLWGIPAHDISYKSGEDPLAVLGLVVLKGRAALKIGYTEISNLEAPPGPALFAWDNVGSGAEKRPAIKLPQPLPWWSKVPAPPASEAMQKAGREMEIALKELSNLMTDPKRAVDTLLRENLQAPLASTRVLAVRCLGAIDEVAWVLAALRDEKFTDVRIEAIAVLRHWLGRSKTHYEQLGNLLQAKMYTPIESEYILQLLHGFTEQNLSDPETYAALIQYLNHNQLAIRQLASWRLTSLVPAGRKIAYDPAGGTDQRNQAIAEWKRLIPEGKLPPRPQAPPSGTAPGGAPPPR